MGKILAAYLFPHPPIIIPEIGRGEERRVKKTIDGVKALSQDISVKKPDTIIVITPHGPIFSDAIAISVEEKLYGDFGRFGFSRINFNFENNLNLVKEIIKRSNREGIIMAELDMNFARDYNVDHEIDHGVLVPLYFVDKLYRNYKLIHITYGMLPPKDLYRFGKIIQGVVKESQEQVVVLASGDLSHRLSNDGPYSYSPEGKKFDEAIVDILKRGDLEDIVAFDFNLAEKAGECGLRSLMVMAGTLDRLKFDSTVLSYEGPFGVGYATAKLEVTGEKKGEDLVGKIEQRDRERIKRIRQKESEYVRLARKSLEYFLKHGKYMPVPENLSPKLLREKKAVFVTLKKDGLLRGCIGTTEPREDNVALEIIRNAVSAGTEDPRFPKVEQDELDKLVYSVDLLFEPEPIESIDQLDVCQYGVIVEKGFKKGLLLPNIEGVDTVERQVSIALEKANIREDEDFKMKRFKVIRYN